MSKVQIYAFGVCLTAACSSAPPPPLTAGNPAGAVPVQPGFPSAGAQATAPITGVPIAGMQGAGLVGGSAAIPTAPGGSQTTLPPVTPPVAPTATPQRHDPDNWAGFGGDLAQSYARPSAMIEESNLKQLGSAWETAAPAGVTGTPAVFDGVVYWADWIGNAHAQRITDGTEVWNPKVKLSSGVTSSPFVDEQRVYYADRDNKVHALERMTGKEVWTTSVSDNPLSQLWSSPTVADGVVVVGLGGKGTSNGGVRISMAMLMTFRGGVVGLDAQTGKVRWKFENTMGPDGKMYGPGVSSWSTAALDTTRKIAYIGTGNSYYSPASPYSDSLIALKYLTTNPKGELVWSQQFTKDDNFTSGNPMGPDSDVGATPNLFSVDGKDYVGVGDKGGGFYVMDRDKGEYLYPRVRVSTGGATGGVMAPAAYGDGTLYITTNNSGSTLVLAMNAKDGKTKWSTMEPSGVSYGAPLLLKDVLLIGPTSAFSSGAARGGQILAFRRSDGMKVNWSLPLKNQRGGGMSVYRNTLFFNYGYVFENDAAESMLMGGVLAAALGGKVIEPGPIGPVATHAPTYSAIYKEIFAEKGCAVDRCHGGLGIQLQDMATAYDNLINGAPTAGCTTMKFVVPSNPAQSYLYLKLQASPPCGSRMPLNEQPLSDEELGQIRMWIEMGAQRN